MMTTKTTMTTSSLFEQIGRDALRAVVADFYERVFADVMIGFLFFGKDRQRLIDKEFEFVANFLGAGVRYTGRPMRAAHARTPIMGGHFDRRLQLLKETLADRNVPAEVRDVWIKHTLALRSQVTDDATSECNDVRASRFVSGGSDDNGESGESGDESGESSKRDEQIDE
jgi:hemoglobin